MAFREQVQQLGAGVSAEQAVSLMGYIVDLTERAEANPGVWNASVSTLMQKASDEGFDAANFLETLQQLAKAAVPVEDQVRLAAELEKQLARNASIREITAEISSAYPSVKAKMLELIDAAKAETRSLTAVAGGTSHKVDFKKTWQKTPNATKKQKWEKAGIDSLELVTVASILSRSAYAVQYKILANRIAAIPRREGWNVNLFFNQEIPDPWMGKGFKYWILKDGPLGPSVHEHWETKAASAYSEIKKWVPGHIVYNFIKVKYIDKRPAPTPSDNDDLSSRASSYLSDHELEIESAAGDVDVSRIERELERNSAEITDYYQSLMDKHSRGVKIFSNLRSSWGSLLRPGSFGLDELKTDLVDGAKALGSDVEKAAIGDITQIVEAEENIIESE